MIIITLLNFYEDFLMLNKLTHLSIFHHPGWHTVLRKTYKFYLINFKKLDSNNNIIGTIPFVVEKKRQNISYISLPFSDYCNFYGFDFSDELLNELLLKHKNNLYIEIRDKVLSNRFDKHLFGYLHYLELTPSENDIFKKFKKTQTQQCIYKAQKSGLRSVISNDWNSINNFYELHLLTRKKLGIPIQPKVFFFYIWKEIINNGLGFVSLIYLSNKLISAGVFMGNQESLTYKYSASDPRYLNYRPNHLMLWTAIQEAKKRGYKILDFGRTELEHEGLRKFKLGWGTTEKKLYYSYYPKYSMNNHYNFFIKHILSPFIKISPKFICRITGEIFYKYNRL